MDRRPTVAGIYLNVNRADDDDNDDDDDDDDKVDRNSCIGDEQDSDEKKSLYLPLSETISNLHTFGEI